MTQLQFLATVGAVTLLFVAGGALGSVFTLWLSDRPERAKKTSPAPKPQRAKPHVAHVVPRPPESAQHLPALTVDYLPRRTLMIPPGGLDDDDVTEVRDKTRLDLMRHHTAWGPQARGEERAS